MVPIAASAPTVVPIAAPAPAPSDSPRRASFSWLQHAETTILDDDWLRLGDEDDDDINCSLGATLQLADLRLNASPRRPHTHTRPSGPPRGLRGRRNGVRERGSLRGPCDRLAGCADEAAGPARPGWVRSD